MPLTPNDLLEPLGSLSPAFFPSASEADLQVRLQAYLNDGEARATAAGISGATTDRAVRAWAEYRAFDAVAKRLAIEPSSVTIVDQGARSRTNDQLKVITGARDAALAVWNAAVPVVDEVSTATMRAAAPTVSRAAPVRFVW